MSAGRFETAVGVAIATIGLGLLAFTQATEIGPAPPKAPVQVAGWSQERPKLATVEAGPPPGIPCDTDPAAGKTLDPGIEAVAAEDPYAG